MCGISGFWSTSSEGVRQLEEIGRAMSRTLRHRGPDADGIWSDTDAGIVLAHRRLSILDPSPQGAQPMLSASGRHVVVYNGEIYNHPELRRRLEAAGNAPDWRGHSDTETLLAAIDAWGIEQALDAASGMFAFALWDRAERTFHLARDRMGEKPLYFGNVRSGLAFASELKAILAVTEDRPELDRAALAAYMSHGYVPEGQSIYAGVFKVPPGAILRFDGPASGGANLRERGFLAETIEAGVKRRSAHRSLEASSVEVEHVLRDVVSSQMVSDVPLGSFLSGGIDSTLVTALMQSVSTRPVRTFSVGFREAAFDESAHAAAVAKHIGTDHTEFVLTEADALAVIPELSAIYDEPFADSSQIPTVLLCREARRAVTVALTGDGGDEVFGGYNRHIFVPRAWAHARRIPTPLRRRFGLLAGVLHRLGGADNPLLRSAIRRAGLPASTLEKIAGLGSALGRAESLPDLYRALTRVGPGSGLLRGSLRAEALERDPVEGLDLLEPAEWMMAMDSLTYLPGDILVKVDRAAMAASLETRAPFLDRRVVEAAWSLPAEMRIRGREGKRILRAILDRHVPRDLVERPKQGFAIPLDRWLRTELRPWAETLLDGDRIEAQGVLDPKAVRAMWEAHLAGRRNAGPAIWTALMLVAWIDRSGAEGQGACRIAA